MNRLPKFLMITAAAVMMAACAGDRKKQLVPSSGAPYEVYGIVSHEIWNGALGDTIESVMTAPVPYLNAYEPQFDLYRLAPNQFNNLIKISRNLLIVSVDEKYPQPRLVAEYDKYAAPQLIVYAIGPDKESLTSYIYENGEKLREIYTMAERERQIAFAKRAPSKTYQDLVKQKFGIDINLLQGFIKGKETDGFLWMRYRYPESDQELTIYSYPYTGPEDLSAERLLERRDQHVALIPGEVKDSHMITNREIDPGVRHLRINGRFWVEMRGFWEVKNDFMGGPYVSFTTVDETTNRVVTIDGAVYSPSPYKTKRNLLRQLESIVYGVKFPSDRERDQAVAGDSPAQRQEQQEVTIEEITVE